MNLAPYKNITITELAFDGLLYDSFIDYHEAWIKNDDLSWTTKDVLAPNEYKGFIVKFKTTDVGDFVNVISSQNKTANDTVKVVKPDFTIEKIAVNSTVRFGEQAVFEIIIRNIGIVNLTDVKITELKHDGLIYDHYIDDLGDWSENSLVWTLNAYLHLENLQVFMLYSIPLQVAFAIIQFQQVLMNRVLENQYMKLA